MNDSHKTLRAVRPLQERIDRRGFFRGAAGVSIAALGTGAALGQLSPVVARGTEVEADAGGGAAQLESQTRRVLRWAGQDPSD